jgi:hypothetical protein
MLRGLVTKLAIVVAFGIGSVDAMAQQEPPAPAAEPNCDVSLVRL